MGDAKLDLLQGTLDLMVLKTLATLGSVHGYGIARRIEQVSGDEVLLNQGTITRTSAKEVFEGSFRDGQPPEQIVAARGLAVIGAGDALAAIAREAIAANPKAVAEYRAGKTVTIKFLVGQVMRATKGQASPQAAEAALESALRDDA